RVQHAGRCAARSARSAPEGRMSAPAHDVARERATMPAHAAAILDRRSLAKDHRRLAALLRPGHAVLDVGCGTGAITRGIAATVRAGGPVVAVDTNRELIEAARRAHGRVPGLRFDVQDACALPYRDCFDVVTASRVLQWLADPARALAAMIHAVRPGGRVVVLDYNHERLRLEPAPAAAAQGVLTPLPRLRAPGGVGKARAAPPARPFRPAGLERGVG